MTVWKELRQGTDMIEFSTFKPNLLAPTIVVDQVLGFYRVGGLVQVTYGFTTTTAGGTLETVQGANLLWEPKQLLSSRAVFDFVMTEWRDGAFRDVAPETIGLGRPRTQ